MKPIRTVGRAVSWTRATIEVSGHATFWPKRFPKDGAP